MTVTGLTSLVSNIQKLAKQKAKKEMRLAVAKGARVVRKVMRQLTIANRASGTLTKSIAYRVKQYKDNDITIGIIGPDHKTSGVYSTGGRVERRVPWRYAHLADKPHKLRNGKKSKGSYFLKRAQLLCRAETSRVVRESLTTGLIKAND